jgi:hypothetical protein
MKIPGFVACAALNYPKSARPALETFVVPRVAAGRIELQQLSPCLAECQVAWSDCIGQCAWWEWVVGSCVPKCRLQWVSCVSQC